MRAHMSFFIILFSFLSFTSQTQANYIKAHLGVVNFDSSLAMGHKTSGLGLYTDLDSKITSPILISYGFSLNENLNLEVEAGYRQNKTEVNTSSKASSISIGTNAIYRFTTSVLAKPYLGTGLAVAQYNIKGTGSDEKEIAFAFQILSGVDFEVVENLSLGLEVRHFSSLFGPDFSVEGDSYNGLYKHVALSIT